MENLLQRLQPLDNRALEEYSVIRPAVIRLGVDCLDGFIPFRLQFSH
jgi:hypothetical protein